MNAPFFGCDDPLSAKLRLRSPEWFFGDAAKSFLRCPDGVRVCEWIDLCRGGGDGVRVCEWIDLFRGGGDGVMDACSRTHAGCHRVSSPTPFCKLQRPRCRVHHFHSTLVSSFSLALARSHPPTSALAFTPTCSSVNRPLCTPALASLLHWRVPLISALFHIFAHSRLRIAPNPPLSYLPTEEAKSAHSS